ncbi:MAG: mechanosensitive ion channel [Sphaerochaetaceae bacterium]|jgi:small-conductance mechanosensitive channel|nr:mechanosensitive ion channel [Sphaerochaetaceae bacterium]MDY0371119.1 mechanosensitive ion channel [Sphaerochaetaceae bacterium]
MQFIDFLGSAIVVVVGVVLVIVVRALLNRSIRSTSGKSFPYHRQLITFAIALLGVFLAIGLLPLEHQVKTQILSVLGLLLSAVIAISSTTIVSNAMAGIMLRLMQEFRGGDFIEVEKMVGRVTNFGIFHTEIQTITRDVVSLPNLMLVQKPVKVTRRGGTFIHLAVAIGYTTSHAVVEQHLRQAAESIGLKDVFIFVEELLDHAIKYRVYGLLEESAERLSKTSDLHKAVLDTLHANTIEIASPSIMDRREFPNNHLYRPKERAVEEKKEDEVAIEEVAFDKAEEAESIEQLRIVEKKLVASLEKLSSADLSKKIAKQRKSQIEEKIKDVQKEIAEREADQAEKKEAGD